MADPTHGPESVAQIRSLEEELERVSGDLDTATRQTEEYLDLLRHARADFANFKRRTEASRAEQAADARAEVLLRILPILDDLQRALAVPADRRASQDWERGIELIEQKLRDLLNREGLQQIEAHGATFNPWEHEAVQYEASPELEDQRVLEVVREGYRMGDRVIRPAQVVVARRTR
jgi:molecular chaperone GrpE